MKIYMVSLFHRATIMNFGRELRPITTRELSASFQRVCRQGRSKEAREDHAHLTMLAKSIVVQCLCQHGPWTRVIGTYTTRA